ncbi:MAG TPA: PEP-CTERM sorting domain-containing protein [Verrucomicrobiae bacterium]|nr:PEP-CTERM sorting domain-containing protein [Verrucomicrobiae bacterium]
MRKLALIIIPALGLFNSTLYALPDYDPFADATGSGGTSYTVGANLVGQTNAQGQGWSLAGSTGAQPVISAGNLTVSGLASSGGNSVSYGMAPSSPTPTVSARFNLGSTINSGTIYYSMALQVTSLGSLTTGGAFIAGFNNSAGSQSSTPSTFASRVYTRLSGTGFNVGLDLNGSTATQYASPTYNVGDTLFLVGSYTFVTGTANDTASMWINPDSSTFGAGTAPASTLTSSSSSESDIAQIASFMLRDGSALEPGVIVDDLRVGASWADVTPAVPEPGTTVLCGLGFGVLALIGWSRRSRQ